MCVTIFSTGGKFRPVSILTLFARSYALLLQQNPIIGAKLLNYTKNRTLVTCVLSNINKMAYFYSVCAVRVTIFFRTSSKFCPVSNFTYLHALTQVACSYALLVGITCNQLTNAPTSIISSSTGVEQSMVNLSCVFLAFPVAPFPLAPFFCDFW